MNANLKQEFGKVGVLFGGRSAEREISLMSGSGVLEALLAAGVDAHAFDPAMRTLADLAAEKFDRIFIALHGRYGEDGTLQGALEQMGIPYTGPGVLASAIAMDKAMTKRVWLFHGLSTPRFEMLHAQSDWNQVAATLGLPLIVKPAHEGSTLGLTKITDASQLPAAYAQAAKFDRAVMAEEFISGMELTCPVLGEGDDARALPVVRIVAPDANYDYQNKYFSNETQYLCPSGLPEAQENRYSNWCWIVIARWVVAAGVVLM
jgi:D-alanine-D-alanine ligase